MLNPNLYEISTIESPAQSPKKIQKQSNILPQNMNLVLQKLKTEKKNFFPAVVGGNKKEKEEKHKIGENILNEGKIEITSNAKKAEKNDKNGILLDFDFLVGEFLDKIILGKNILSLKENKKKVDIRKRKKFTKIKGLYSKINNEQKSKFSLI